MQATKVMNLETVKKGGFYKNMKNYRIIMLTLIVMVVVLHANSIQVYALKTSDGMWNYNVLEENEIIINTYRGNEKDVSIPDSIDGKTVTRIGNSAFSDNGNLESIIIPDSVTYIDNFAFSDCSNLRNVVFSDNVTNLDFGVYVFSGCKNLENIVLPNGVTKVSEGMFESCSSLESVTLPNEVERIGDNAFSRCSSLKNITIPNGVTSISGSVFSGCSSLQAINVANENTGLTSENGVLYNKEKTILYRVPGGLSSCVVADSTIRIGEYSFSECNDMETISIPEGVTSIGDNAFLNCSVVKQIVLPDSLESIGKFAFNGCSTLERINIPKNLVDLGSGNRGDVYEGIFFDCESLQEINVDAENSVYASYDGILYNKDMTTMLCVPRGVVSCSIPEGVTSIGDGAFFTCRKLEEIEIPDGVNSIGSNAFSSCSKLKKVTMADSVTKIGTEAFAFCESLTSVELSDNLDEISRYLFYASSALEYINIPDGVTSIGSHAFNGCSGLTGELVIPEGVTSIGYGAFRGCSNLASIMILGSVTEIDGGDTFPDYTFPETERFTLIVVPESYAETYATKYNIPYKYQGQVLVTIKNSNDVVVSTVGIDMGAILNEPEPSETRNTYTFLGFFNGDTKFDFSQPITSDIILTEKWEENKQEETSESKNEDIDKDDSNVSEQESEITLNTKTLSFDTIGATQTLTATVTPDTAADKTVTWTSSDTKVATVMDGVVTSVGNGTAVITAKTADEKTATATVTVSQKTTKLTIQLNGQNVSGALKAKVKKSYSFKAVVTPSNADAKNAKVTWTSSNKKIATVTSKGKVTIKKTGKVTITAKTADGRKATVKLNATKKAVKVTKLTITGSKTMKVKEKQTLKLKIAPATADNRKVTWKSSNKKVATVNSKGVVTAKKKGKVTITATAKDGSKKKATIKITVKK